MRSDSICFNEMDGWKFITLSDIQILSIDVRTQGAHIFCLCNRFLFYSKRTLHLTFASTIDSDVSLTVYKSMLNKRWITLTTVFCRPFASKGFLWAILKDFEYFFRYEQKLRTQNPSNPFGISWGKWRRFIQGLPIYGGLKICYLFLIR